MQSKLEFSPLVTTREASFQLLKPVPLHRSLLITCRIKASMHWRARLDLHLPTVQD